MYDDSPDLVEGEMTITTGGRKTATQPGQPDFNTLDEPIKETMVFYSQMYSYMLKQFNSFFQLRDIKAVGVKFLYVLYPKEKSNLLRDCKLN